MSIRLPMLGVLALLLGLTACKEPAVGPGPSTQHKASKPAATPKAATTPKAKPAATPKAATKQPGEKGPEEGKRDLIDTAVAQISPKSGSNLAGQAVFNEVKGGVRIAITVEDAPPGVHAVHIHEKGDCGAPDGSSAGGHFNPTNSKHGLPDSAEHHLGDLGNMTVGADGKGSLNVFIPKGCIQPRKPKSFLSRAIIVHAKKDDGGQPTGNAGARIGCGIIRDVQPKK